jgi:general secretion pathway protein G
VLPNLIGKSEEAKQKLVCVQMQSIAQALKMFKLDNGNYPDTEEGLKALVKNPDSEKYPNYSQKGYFSNGQLPKDPWGHPYVYIKTEDGFNLISLGADGKEGGTGENKDISYEDCLKK